MVIESLINPFKAKEKPWEMFFVGFLYSTVALFLGLWIFQEYASLVMIFLTVLASIPLLYKTIINEYNIDIEITNQESLLKEHSRTIYFLILMFMGMTAAFTLWYVILPITMTNSLFAIQTQTITILNQQVIGNVTKTALLSKIFLNNVKVLLFCIIFSFLYGAGAIFILTWNASVIATAMGNFIRSHLSSYAATAGSVGVASYFYIISLSLLRYVIHGIPEILAYFIAALAGGIISVAVVKHTCGTRKFEKVFLDATDLVLIALVVLFIAALLEVYITPFIFGLF